MQSFLLVLLTMNIQTGEVVKSATVGDPFKTYDDCIQGAISRGPQVSDGLHARMLVCRASDDTQDNNAVAPGSNVL